MTAYAPVWSLGLGELPGVSVIGELVPRWDSVIAVVWCLLFVASALHIGHADLRGWSADLSGMLLDYCDRPLLRRPAAGKPSGMAGRKTAGTNCGFRSS
jgi:hypothetical protein